MAIELNNPNDVNVVPEVPVGAPVNDIQFGPQPNSGNAPMSSTSPVIDQSGLSQDELNDPNKIKVTITDKNTPIVVLYGPPSCGKTMTLIRLTRFLASQGYTVVPEKTFRPSYDSAYREMCENFSQMINSHSAATSTSHTSFMLVKVLKNGKPICQFLEAPGELYFSPDNPNMGYPSYVYEIMSSTNRKVWTVMVEPDWDDASVRANYVTRISQLKSQMMVKDKVLFIFNKIDLTPYVRSVGQVNTTEAITNVGNLYPGIFTPFENTNPVTRFFRKYDCEFVPFTTGNYAEKMDGGLTYIESHPVYSKKLWETILKMIGG